MDEWNLEKCHRVDVEDFVGVGDGVKTAPRSEFVGCDLTHLVLVTGEGQLKVSHVSIVVFHVRQTAEQLLVQRGQLIYTAVQSTTAA